MRVARAIGRTFGRQTFAFLQSRTLARLLSCVAICAASLSVLPCSSSRADVRLPNGLVTQDAKAFGEPDTRGKPAALFFGYTNCPDICPATLFQLSNDLAALGKEADSLSVLFVSVDPARDSPAVLKEYLSSFDQRIVGLTGSVDAIATLARTYGATFRKVAAGNGYTIDHSPAVFLLTRGGELAGILNFEEDRASQLAKLRELLR
jgi:protein SCO1/2